MIDDDAMQSPRRDSGLLRLMTEDLSPLSLEDLKDRIEGLKAEIVRCQTMLDSKKSRLNAADALFSFKASD